MVRAKIYAPCSSSLTTFPSLLGPIVRLSLAGDEIVVLNKAEDAEQLVRFYFSAIIALVDQAVQLNKRSQNYSSRKPLIYAGKYQSQNKRLVLLPYGEELRKQRAAFHHMLQSRGGYMIKDFDLDIFCD